MAVEWPQAEACTVQQCMSGVNKAKAHLYKWTGSCWQPGRCPHAHRHGLHKLCEQRYVYLLEHKEVSRCP